METTQPNEALANAIAKYPSLKAFAGELSVPYQTVQQWMRTRVPSDYCTRIEKMTAGEVCCEDLRPDFDWAYLRATPLPVKRTRARRKASPDTS